MSDDPIRVLLMEDDAGLARLCRLRLERAGYVVTLARDGEEGLARFDAGTFDVVALDHRMPVYDGLEVMRRLASRGRLPPIVMVTGAGDERIAVEALRLGARDYVVKDTDGRYLELLPTVVERVLRIHRMEEALRQSEERLREVVRNAQEWIWEVDSQGLLTYSSPAAFDILGYTPEEVVGRRHFYDFFQEDERESLKQAAFDVLTRPQPFRAFVSAAVHKDGRRVWLETSGAPIMTPEGALTGFRGANMDITQRKAAEESIRHFRSLVDRSSDMVLITDPDSGRVLDANETACRSLGYSREEILRLAVLDFDPFVYAGRSVAEVADALREAGRLTVESRHRRKDGTTYPVEVTLNYVVEAGAKYVVAFCRDITDRLEAEAATRRLAAIVESSMVAIFTTAPDGTITSWNAGAERLYEYTAKEVLGRPVSILAPADRHDEVDQLVERLRGGEKIDELETERLAKSGRRIQVLLSIAPIRDRHGQTAGNSTIVRDITKRKAAEEALRVANRRLEELATTDELTGLWNRRHFMKTLAVELERARRQGSAVSLVLFDADRFKTLNDTYGHGFGDEVLAMIGQTLRDLSRVTDVAARYGGDEFVILAPGTLQPEMMVVAERICEHVAAYPLKARGHAVPVSLTGGVATVVGAAAVTPEELIASADAALYAAKAAGRRCVRASEPLLGAGATVPAANSN